jgi:formate dehydrogenase major subunit
MEKISSVCPYCGCGCKLIFVVEKGKVKKVLPDEKDEVSKGKPCIKGLTLNEVLEKGRIKSPMIRKSKFSKLKKVSWEKAYEFIYKKIKKLSPEEIFFVASGKITNEDNYALQKFARVIIKTNNVDSCCSRVCHQATIEGLKNVFGSRGNPWRIDEIADRDCILLIGTNPASNYPVIFNRLLEAKRRGTKIISVQSIANLTSQYADLALTIYPGTETALLNGIMKFLIEKNEYLKECEKIEGFDQLKKVVEKYNKEFVCEICKLSEKDFLNLCSTIAESKRFGALHGMGLTQHVNAVENVHSLLNLLLLKNGKLLSCRGEINVQGASDMGCSPISLPADGITSTQKLEKIWGRKLSKAKGKTLIEAFLISPVKAAFVSAFNPAQSLPNLNVVHKNLRKMFVVQMESYFNLTSKFADVILPTPILLERIGTATTGERRIRLVNRVVKPIGKPEWLIMKELSKFFKSEKFFPYQNELEIFGEITEIIPDYRVDADFIYKGNDGWASKEIKFKKFIPEEFEGVEEVKSEKYPFILTTFRSPYQFLTGEMSKKSKTLSKFEEEFCFINSKDAKKLKLKNGEKVKIASSVGRLIARIKIDNRFPSGIVGMNFHSKNLLVNKLFPTRFDEETMTPNFKLVAVKIEKA